MTGASSRKAPKAKPDKPKAKAKANRIEHREPTPATAKRLYGTAYRCGKPDCKRPLYRVNDETGEEILNSRISHIHARSQDGPRWDPAMSEAANRDAANLIPMCLEHADEIDVTPEHYPADLLREWKQAQRAEYQQIHRSWNLTDDQAAEVVQVSFTAHDVGAASAGADAVLRAARAAGLVIETARQLRRGPQRAAATWQALRARANASMLVYDSNGERLPVEPSWAETKPHAEALQTALVEAVTAVEPLAIQLVAELHAVQAANSQLTSWCNWVETATADVVKACGYWPQPGPIDDDHVLDETLSRLRRASAALGAAWRGDTVEQPPPPPSAEEPVEDAQQRAGREHRELLDLARPWARVDHRPYNPDLYSQLVQTANYAIGIPRVPRTLTVDLICTARLAARVARNADEDTYATLVDQAAALRPLAIAVTLLRELMRVADGAARPTLAAQAKEEAIRLLQAENWQDHQVWENNELYAKMLHDLTAEVTSNEKVRQTITSALHSDHDLLPRILRSIVQWSEQLDSQTWETIGIRATISDIPAWFPAQEVVAEIRQQLPDLSPADDEDDDIGDNEFHRLASHMLRITPADP